MQTIVEILIFLSIAAVLLWVFFKMVGLLSKRQRTNRHSAPHFTEIPQSDYSLSMRNLFIIPLVLLSLVSFPSWSETLSLDDLVERNGLFYKKFTDIPFTGEVSGILEVFFESGKFKNGEKNGEWLMYYDNGQLSSRFNYKDVKKDGVFEYFHKDGHLASRGNYKNDKEEGSRVEYWRMEIFSGNIISEMDNHTAILNIIMRMVS